ncbi:MAG: hypothetical protein V3573_02795 [Desulfovibrionaceae bacterium]
MSYKSEDMRLMGGVPGQQLFLYRTADDAAAVAAAGYFNQAVEHYTLSRGDIVLCVSGQDASPALDALVVTVNNGIAGVTALA